MKRRQAKVVLRALLVCMLVMASLNVIPRTGEVLHPITTGGGWIARWDLDSLPGGVIEYWVNPTFPPGVQPIATHEQLVQTVQRAFQIWEDVPTSRVRFRFMGLTNALAARDGKNVVTFVRPDHVPDWAAGFALVWQREQLGPVTLPTGRVVQASFPGQIIDADTVINTRFRFTITDEHPLPTGNADLLGLLVHEIGHMIGLGHSGIGQTSMTGFGLWDTFFLRELSADDILGVSMLYPEEGFLLGQGRIVGRVQHPGGAPVFGAHVVAIEAQTGRVIRSTISGLSAVGSDGVPQRFSRTSGDFVLMVPPGEYFVLAEPFGGEGKGRISLWEIFSWPDWTPAIDTNFAPALSSRVSVAAGQRVDDQTITVGARSPQTPVIRRAGSPHWGWDLRAWAGHVRAMQGTIMRLSLEGLNLTTAGTTPDRGLRARFLATGIEVTDLTVTADGVLREIEVSIALNAPVGLHVLEVTTTHGAAYFPGALQVIRAVTIVTPPPQVILASPAQGVTTVSATPTLNWLPAQGATDYLVKIARNPDFTDLVTTREVVSTSTISPALAYNTQYWWKVRGSNVTGAGPWSVGRTFTTAAATIMPPPYVVLSSPAPGVTGGPITPTLRWQPVDRATAYEVWISRNDAFSALVLRQTVAATEVVSHALPYDTRHWWAVRAINAAGAGPWSGIWTFTTAARVVTPAQVLLSSPPQGAGGIPTAPQLNWQMADRATRYQIWISRTADFTDLVVNQEVFGTVAVVSPALAGNTRHWWKVRGINFHGAGPWSDVRTFTTAGPVAHVITIGRTNPAIGLDVPANVVNGRLMVPFRWFAERILNATVEFSVVGAAEVVSLQRNDMQVELTLNSNRARVNGVSVALDVAPLVTGGRTLVPARFLAETFGYVVHWNPATNEVTFTLRP